MLAACCGGVRRFGRNGFVAGALGRRSRGYANGQPAASGRTAPAPPSFPSLRPAYHVAERSEAAKGGRRGAGTRPGQANEHPLMPVLRWAYAGMGNIEKIHDYSATLAKRERIGGKLLDYQYMFIKLRQKPFSVYMCFLGPADMKGREVIYVEGQNNGNMYGTRRGLREDHVRHPFAEARRTGRHEEPALSVDRAWHSQHDPPPGRSRRRQQSYGECEVKFYEGAKINGRVCTCIEVVHPVPRRNFVFHLARIFVDKELNLPIRYESYDWPKEPGGPPELMEEYTYVNLKLNNGYTDADFDTKNPNYKFP